jgi:hypothetical protein
MIGRTGERSKVWGAAGWNNFGRSFFDIELLFDVQGRERRRSVVDS